MRMVDLSGIRDIDRVILAGSQFELKEEISGEAVLFRSKRSIQSMFVNCHCFATVALRDVRSL